MNSSKTLRQSTHVKLKMIIEGKENQHNKIMIFLRNFVISIDGLIVAVNREAQVTFYVVGSETDVGRLVKVDRDVKYWMQINIRNLLIWPCVVESPTGHADSYV